jgi:hypothetical protein
VTVSGEELLTLSVDDYWAGADRGEAWTVDTAFLESAARELGGLADFITDRFLPHFHDIGDRMGSSEHSPFGGPKVRTGKSLWSRHDQFLSIARQRYAGIAQQLRDAQAATQQVAANYRSTEDRNAANAQAIERAFQDPTSAGAPGTGGPASTPPV